MFDLLKYQLNLSSANISKCHHFEVALTSGVIADIHAVYYV